MRTTVDIDDIKEVSIHHVVGNPAFFSLNLEHRDRHTDMEVLIVGKTEDDLLKHPLFAFFQKFFAGRMDEDSMSFEQGREVGREEKRYP